VTLTSGALALGGSSTLSGQAVTSGGAGTGTLSLNGGSIGFASSGVTISNALAITGTVEFGGSTTNGLASNAITFGGATTIAANSVLTSPSSGTTTQNSVAFNSSVIPLSTVTLGGNISVLPASGSKFIFDDAIGDNGSGFGITIGNGTTTGTVVMGSNTTNPNTYSGATSVLSGTLDVAATQALNNSTLVTTSTAGSTVFDSTVSSHAFTFGGLSGTGNLGLQDNATTPNAVALSVGNNNTSTSYSGTLSGAGSVTKIGTGALTLSGGNTYTGATLVKAGSLNVTGSLAAGSAVTVGNNTAVATLAGNGTINGSLTTTATTSFAAHVAPGAVAGQVGTLHVGSLGFSVGDGTNFDFDLGATLGNTSAGGSLNDEIVMAGGTLNFGGSAFFNFDALTALSTSGTYTLIDDSAGSITGFNAANFHATGTGGDVATFSVVGNDLVVTFSSGGTESTQYYYTGGTSHDFTAAGNFNDAASGAMCMPPARARPAMSSSPPTRRRICLRPSARTRSRSTA
jgi:autotransporter-associated beta strand protein